MIKIQKIITKTATAIVEAHTKGNFRTWRRKLIRMANQTHAITRRINKRLCSKGKSAITSEVVIYKMKNIKRKDFK